MISKWSGKGILVRAIVEMLGAPSEHVEKTLHDYVKALKDRDDLKIIKSNYAEPQATGKMFSVFVELEMRIKGMPELMGFCIESMPSSIEILEPDKLEMTAEDLTDIFNDLQAKLHNISLSIKNVTAQNRILEQNTQVLATNLVGIALKGVSLSKEELAKITGIPVDKMDDFLNSLVEEKRIIQSGNLYSLNK